MTRLLCIVFRFEWRQLTRQFVPVFALLFFLAMGSYSLYNGKKFVSHQLDGLDSLEQHHRDHRRALLYRFQADTTTAEGKTMAAQAGIPQVVEYRNPPYAAFPPHRLSALAIGQRDLLPYFDIITSKRDVFSSTRTTITNPEKLAAGNFDFSFVLIYLFPLLLMVWSYDIYSSEMEQQTERLVAVQGGHIKRILALKLLFRFLWVCTIAWLLSIAGFWLHRETTGLTVTDALLWLFGVTLYLLFWCAVTWWTVLGKKSSRLTLIRLLGIWFALTFLLPAITNEIVEVSHPLPARTELISAQREEIEHTWDMPVEQLLDTFYINNPQYTTLKSPGDTAHYGNRRFVAYYDLLGRRINRHIKKYNMEVAEHNALLRRLGWFSPVAQMQTFLNAVARTGMDDYLTYREQVGTFHDEWVIHMNNFMLYDKKLDENDIQNLPRFELRENRDQWKKTLLLGFPVFLFVILIFLAAKRKSIY
ncbi:DUF3526 domain-containing protein [Sinomicrobium pectinilyticum]|uniref:DUF3526 domain-containing protein n=1 Tax=Sinomicrobium pectinilyticum TaxID=1084421 RepID=A0A3N0E1K1_SINP1|nr:DUF3526 domain-containing protein [Sinomicrobium pectinilyticum]RNL81734.1 DUF3526 domain-containing protein [Sinomicrobium pectinilyticum]